MAVTEGDPKLQVQWGRAAAGRKCALGAPPTSPESETRDVGPGAVILKFQLLENMKLRILFIHMKC